MAEPDKDFPVEDGQALVSVAGHEFQVFHQLVAEICPGDHAENFESI